MSLARPTPRCILFDGENISFDASLVIYINSTNIPPVMIINRIYEHQNLLSLQLVSFLVGLRTYQHPCSTFVTTPYHQDFYIFIECSLVFMFLLFMQHLQSNFNFLLLFFSQVNDKQSMYLPLEIKKNIPTHIRWSVMNANSQNVRDRLISLVRTSTHLKLAARLECCFVTNNLAVKRQ